ncbi:hypothetical protein OGATHE_005917 [Ogataea polymorpha]|uniref:Uncharacterized protein n=1 Tax=Ogataea polymorpha TaxID=460523 RepID=A0A9P8NV08_9ASCO|nr:hypothetical protein OGATHE_005917 [Ogataea polymorpha]
MAAMIAPLSGSFLIINESRSTSGESDILAAIVLKINLLSLLSLSEGNSIFLSNLPGLKRAGSSVSGLLVAMMTLTLVDWSNPSICVRSSIKILCTSLSAPVWASNLFVAIASISSMKIIDGEFSLASLKTSLTILGPSPRYFCTNSEPFTLINEAVELLATALTSMVLPVPGGPYRRTPRGGSIPICLYRSACVRGNSTASLISCFCMSNPPTSLYVTSGFSFSPTIDIEESASGGKMSTRALE